VPLWDPEHPDNQSSSWFSWLSLKKPIPNHNCHGQVEVNIAWIGDIPDPPNTARTVKNTPTARDLLSIQKIMKWMEGNRIDPNDPRNTGLLSAIENVDNDIIASKGFHLAEQDDALFFDGARDHTYQRRLHLLKLRFESKSKVPIQIPINGDLITASFVKEYETKIAESFTAKDKLRSKYVQQVRSQLEVKDRAKEMENEDQPQRLVKSNIKVSQYVSEPAMPAFSSENSWLSTFFEPKRPLRPTRIDRKHTSYDGSKINRCNIIVQIIRGYNVPLRASDESEAYRTYRGNRLRQAEEEGMAKQVRRTEDQFKQEEHGEEGEYYRREATVIHQENEHDDEEPERVLSFVTITFGNYSRKTKIIEGPFPQFNQTLSFPFEPPNGDFSPEVLSLISQEIYFDIFDELTIDNLKDERDIHVTNRRAEFRWLGSFSIPFEILYSSKQILGTFRVKTPPVRLGYRIDPTVYTALTVCVTLDPPLPQGDEAEDMLSSGEPPELYHQAHFFTQRFKNHSKAKNRLILALVPNIDQKGTLICRYIRPQEPPPDLVKPSQVVRFVSTVPFISDSQSFGSDDRWLTR
jgi:coiled-coil and C2 domain-containing protein 2A